ncbi:MAG: hypothetical protein NTW75_13390 [Planctomycetales bacterium]|jgi:hypothetical protein|nr:hypothetical protein [Planctomycetales bacterium]
MLITFDCPKCLKPNRGQVTDASRGVLCVQCGWSKSSTEGGIPDQIPTRCLVCGCHDLWRQKDFSPKLGIAIVVVGIAISTWFMLLMQPEWSIGTLMFFSLMDMILYSFMKDRLACYRCHAQYRQIPQGGSTFDLEIHERYRQETLRLKQADRESPSLLPTESLPFKDTP